MVRNSLKYSAGLEAGKSLLARAYEEFFASGRLDLDIQSVVCRRSGQQPELISFSGSLNKSLGGKSMRS